MDTPSLRMDIKRLLVTELRLANRTPESIEDDAPIFGDAGLGLDSLDALQLAMAIEEKLGVRLPDGDDARPVFASVAAIADYVAKAR